LGKPSKTPRKEGIVPTNEPIKPYQPPKPLQWENVKLGSSLEKKCFFGKGIFAKQGRPRPRKINFKKGAKKDPT